MDIGASMEHCKRHMDIIPPTKQWIRATGRVVPTRAFVLLSGLVPSTFSSLTRITFGGLRVSTPYLQIKIQRKDCFPSIPETIKSLFITYHLEDHPEYRKWRCDNPHSVTVLIAYRMALPLSTSPDQRSHRRGRRQTRIRNMICGGET